MKVHLKRQDQAVHFLGTNSIGNSIHIDSSAIGPAESKGVSPMELLLMGVAGCSSIDIVMILEKMRQPLDDLEIFVEGKRADEVPRVFTDIQLRFVFTGHLKKDKVESAIEISLAKYCSVSKMLEKTAKIDYVYEIKIPQDA
ncbi:MAG: OsmC family protein [Bacteroidota bacterium]